jgi:hypothetical protein
MGPLLGRNKRRRWSNEKNEVQQIPTEYNEEQILRYLRRQNRVHGQERVKTINNIPIAATLAQVSKDLVFPTNKKRIIDFIEEQATNNPKSYEILPLLKNIDEEKEYHNTFEITKEAGLVQ